MGETDSAFKTLVQLAPQDFVSTFQPGAEYVQTITIELPRDPLRVDELLKIRYPETGKEFIWNMEAQLDADDTMPERLCQYSIGAYMREGLGILSTVFYLERCKTPTPPFIMAGPTGDILTFHYQVVRLWEEPVDRWLNAGKIALVPFVPLLQGATVEVIEPAMQKLNAIPGPIERGNIVNFLLFFASRTFDPDELRRFLEGHHMLTEKYIVESPWYQYILHQGVEEGERKGKEEGLETGLKQGLETGLKQGLETGLKQGRQEGLKEGLQQMRETIVLLIRKGHPKLERKITTKLNRINDPKRLQEVIVAVATAPDEAAIEAAIDAAVEAEAAE
jgi:predicted transposase YdaD